MWLKNIYTLVAQVLYNYGIAFIENNCNYTFYLIKENIILTLPIDKDIERNPVYCSWSTNTPPPPYL